MARVAVPEDELRTALMALKKERPSIGVAKVHQLILEEHPTWAVSEKRVRRILQSEGLVASGQPNRDIVAIHPSSRLNNSLDVNKWCSKIKVQYFNPIKGKGLVATERITEGEVLWKEDPFILAPEWDIYDLQISSRACAYCSTLMNEHSPLHVPCQSSTSATPCPAMFCNRRCRLQSDNVHPLLCPARNPASISLLKFARRAQWLALHALVQCTSKLLLSAQRQDGSLDLDLQVVHGLAELGMEERFGALQDQGVEPDRETWKAAFDLYLQAFQQPKIISEQKRLARILKKPIAEELQKELFEYDGFLHGLGRMSLNIEAHGGLYKLHSHLNHSCIPNISVRHLDRRNALSRITVIAKKDMEPGEELFITYTNPESEFRERRRALSEWGFGPCQCERCITEEKEAKASGIDTGADELADQLRAGLGLA